MGYSYEVTPTGKTGRLCCDSCGKAGARKRTCPYKVTYIAEGYSLPYCYPAALCPTCYAREKGTLHATCADGAARRNREESEKYIRMEAGDYRVKARWGDWYETVPTGMVGVLFERYGEQEWRLVAKGDNCQWLSECFGESWIGAESNTKEVSAMEFLRGSK